VKRSERLFALAEVLRGRRTGITAEALAERFGVTVRTIYRDLASLRAADLPLSSERGRGGGYALDRHYSLPPVNFTAREAAVLTLAGTHLLAMRIVPFEATLQSGLDKVRAALGASAQRELLRRLESIEMVGVPALPVAQDVRAALETALFEQRPLRVRYRRRPELPPETRRIRVRQVVMDRRETLVNCRDLDRDEDRQLRLHHFEAAEVL
jgi:predicted DNA-binding transcriptional regulator YafY